MSPSEEVPKANSPVRPLALTKPPRFPTSLKPYAPGRSLFSLVLRTTELGSQGSPSPSERAQNPISVSPSCHGRFGPAATTGHWAWVQHSSYGRYQLAVVPPLISPTRANGQEAGAASPNSPSLPAPICIWGEEGAWRQSRRVGELLRGHMSFSLLLSPLPRATFPSYDLCFPSLPVKRGVGTGRRGGSSFRLAVLR